APSVIPVDAEWMRAAFERLTRPDVGGTSRGGVSRPALSDHDAAARELFVELVGELGLTVRVDDIGNVYARRDGTDPTLAPVLIGSHLDTVVPGGRFDGIAGVVAALGAVHA